MDSFPETGHTTFEKGKERSLENPFDEELVHLVLWNIYNHKTMPVKACNGSLAVTACHAQAKGGGVSTPLPLSSS